MRSFIMNFRPFSSFHKADASSRIFKEFVMKWNTTRKLQLILSDSAPDTSTDATKVRGHFRNDFDPDEEYDGFFITSV